MVLVGLLTACATQPAGTVAQSSQPKRAQNVLMNSEVPEVEQSVSVYQAIQKYRPRFLSSSGYSSARGQASATVVYIDDVRASGPQALNDIRMRDVGQIQYLTPGEATMRFGTGHDGGVILVTRKQ